MSREKNMSKYDEYVNKINKIKNIKNTCYRFRMPLIITGSVFALSLSGFLISKGTILKEAKLSNYEITYGEEYFVEDGKALFSDIRHEFKRDSDDQWVSQIPTEPGNYKVRTISSGSFGTKKYGKEFDFVINAKKDKISLTSSSIIYGDSPLYNLDLEYEDYVDSIKFEFDEFNKEETYCNIDLDSIVIKNKEGNDVTSFYNLTTEKAKIKFNKKSIDLIPVLSGKIYDGKEINFEDELESKSISSIVNEDTISFDHYYINDKGEKLETSPIDAGTYTLVLKDPIFKHGDSDVSINYEISIKKLNFTIEKRDLKVETSSYQKEYNGKTFENDFGAPEYKFIDSKLCSNQESVIIEELSNPYFDYIDAISQTDNKFKIGVLENDKDVSKNYRIVYEYGTLTIDQKTLRIKPIVSRNNEYYDGKSYTYSTDENNFVYCDDKELVGDEKIRIYVQYIDELGNKENYYKNASSYNMEINNIEGVNANLSNYNFIYENEKITIKPRELTVKLNNDKVVYSGRSYNYDKGFEYINNQNDNNKLVEGEELIFTYKYNDSKEVFNAGDYSISINEWKGNNNNTVANNYIVTCENSSLQIEKRNIFIKPNEKKKEYDGNTFDYVSSFGYSFNYFGDSLNYEINQFVNNEGVEFDIDYYLNKELCDLNKNVSEYSMSLVNIRPLNESTILDNYNINLDNSSLIVSPRKVKIEPQYINDIIYDGEYHSYQESNKYNVIYNSLVEGESFVISCSFDGEKSIIKDAGQYISSIVNVAPGNNNTLLKNYDIDYSTTNSFVINKRTVYIKPFDCFKESYDGEIFIYNQEKNNFDYFGESINDKLYQIVKNEQFKLNVQYLDLFNNIIEQPKDVLIDDFGNISSYSIIVSSIDGIEESNINNYKFITSSSSLTINPRIVYIKPLSYDGKIYDGESYRNTNFEYKKGIDENNKFVGNDSVSINCKYLKEEVSEDFALNAGNYEEIITNVKEIGETKLNNYKFEFSSNYFTISKRNLKVQLHSFGQDNIYNGEYYSYENPLNYTVQEDDEYLSLPLNHILYLFDVRFNDEQRVKDAGTYSLKVEAYSILNKNGDETKDNFNFEYESSDLKILQKEIEISPIEYSKDYNGENFVYPDEKNNFNVVNDKGLVKDESLIISVDYYLNGKIVSSNKDVSTYTIRIKEISAGDNTLLDNYIINTQDSSLTISPRTVYIKPIDKNSIYNGEEVSYLGNEYEYCSDSINNIDYKFVKDENINISVIINYDTNCKAKDASTYNVSIDKNSIEYYNGAKESNYNIVLNDAKIIISPLEIDITPFSDVITYDGNYYSYSDEYNNFVDAYKLLVKDEKIKIKVLFDGNENSPKNVKSINNIVLSYTVSVNSDEIEYSNGAKKDNYKFKLITGTLTINPRNIYIDYLKMDTITFDHEYHYYPDSIFNFKYNNDDNLYKVINGEELKLSVGFNSDKFGNNQYALHADTYSLNMLDYSVTGNDSIKENYKININNSTFTIKAKELYVKPLEIGDILYNAKPYSYPSSSSQSNCNFVNNSLLLGGDILNIYVYYLDEEEKRLNNLPIEPGNYTICVDETKWDINNENNFYSVSSNYVVKAQGTASLTIIQSTITISPTEIEDKIFDNIPTNYSSGFGNYNLKSVEGISEEQIPLFEVNVLFKNDGKIYNPSSILDAGSYVCYIDSVKFAYPDDESRYYIIKEEIDFTISKKPIDIKPKNQENIFTINGFTYPSNDYVSDLASSEYKKDKIELSVYYLDENDKEVTPFDVGKYKIKIKEVSFIVGNKENYIYDLDAYSAQLTISKREITLMPIEKESKIYDGISYEYKKSDYIVSKNSKNLLEKGQQFEVSKYSILNNDEETNQIKNAGKYNIKIEEIKGVSPTNINNYDITFEEISFEISKKTIELTLSIDFFNGEFYLDNKGNRSAGCYDGTTRTYNVSYGNFKYTSNNKFVGDDNLQITGISCDKEIKNADSYTINSINYEVQGLESNYEIIYKKFNLIIKPRHLIVSLKNKYKYASEFVYDGNYRDGKDFVDAYNIEENSLKLLNGDVLRLNVMFENNGEKFSKIKNVGTYKYILNSWTLNGIEKNTNYEIEFIEDSFKIIKRKISFKLNKIEHSIYNGNQYLANNGYEEVINYCDSDIIIFNVKYFDNSKNEVTPKDAATYYYYPDLENSYDQDYLRLSINYEIKDEISKTFTINPYELKIRPIDEEKTYDGTSSYRHSQTWIDSESKFNNYPFLFNEDTLFTEISCENNPKDVGEYDLIITSTSLNCNESNYNIVIEKGILTIKPQEVTIKALDDEKVYDRTFYKYEKEIEIVKGCLYENDHIKVDSLNFDGDNQSIKNVGTYLFKINDFHFDIGNKSNYEIYIDPNWSTLIINPYELKVKPLEIEGNGKKYDDKFIIYETKYSNYKELINSSSLDISSLSFEITFGFIDCSSSLSYGNRFKNATKTLLYVDSFNVNDSLDETTIPSNYTLSTDDYYYYEILKRKISVISGCESDTMMYDGNTYYICRDDETYYEHRLKAIFKLNKDESEDDLVEGHRFQLTNRKAFEIKDYKEDGYDINLTADIINSDGENVISNYDVTYSSSKFFVTKRPITIETASKELVYNGTNQIDSLCKQKGEEDDSKISYTLKYGPSFDFDKIYTKGYDNLDKRVTLKDAKDEAYDNIQTAYILDKNGKDITNNYEITYVYGKVKILPKEIIIKELKNYVTDYNTKQHFYEDKINNDNAIVYLDEEHSFDKNISISYKLKIVDEYGNVYKDGNLINAGTYYISIADIYINRNSYTSNSNYAIKILNEQATYIINKIDVYYSSKSNSCFYDGNEHSYPHIYYYSPIIMDFKETDVFTIEVDYTKEEEITKVTDPTEGEGVDNVLPIIVKFKDDNVSSNFNMIQRGFGKLKVENSITLSLLSKSYNGTNDGISNLYSNFYNVKVEADVYYLDENGKEFRPIDVGSYSPYLRKNNLKIYVNDKLVEDPSKIRIENNEYKDLKWDEYGDIRLTESFTILPLSLYIKPMDTNITYNGKEFIYPSNNVDFIEKDVYFDAKDSANITRKYYVEGNGRIDPYHTIEGFINNKTIITPQNSGYYEFDSYKIYDLNGNEVEKNENATSENNKYRNYRVYMSLDSNSCNYWDFSTKGLSKLPQKIRNIFKANIKVNKRIIKIKPQGVTMDYNGVIPYNDNYEIIDSASDGLLEGHTLQYKKDKNGNIEHYILKNKLSGVNRINLVVYDENGVDAKNYYSIDYDTSPECYINIKPRSLYITTPSASMKWTGSSILTKNNIEDCIIEGLCEQDEISFNITGKQFLVGTSKNTIDTDSIKIIDKDTGASKKIYYNLNGYRNIKLGDLTVYE